jgi:hypothetical protein
MNKNSRKERVEEQRLISEFIEQLGYAMSAYDCEVRISTEPTPKFVYHDGYTYSIKIGSKKLIFSISTENI